METSNSTALAKRKDLWRERVSIVEDGARYCYRIAVGCGVVALPPHVNIVLGRL